MKNNQFTCPKSHNWENDLKKIALFFCKNMYFSGSKYIFCEKYFFFQLSPKRRKKLVFAIFEHFNKNKNLVHIFFSPSASFIPPLERSSNFKKILFYLGSEDTAYSFPPSFSSAGSAHIGAPYSSAASTYTVEDSSKDFLVV